MKQLLTLLLLCFSMLTLNAQPYSQYEARHTPDWFVTGYTYQIQLRSFTKEGTLLSAVEKLPHLKEIGVRTVYLCPVFVADADPDLKNWSPRQIQSGFSNPKNPYRINDYYHVDPEYGTDGDLRKFVAEAHEQGIYVLLDMVYAHCGSGAVFRDRHPEFFNYDADGRIVLTQWNFPSLNFQSQSLREYLIANMEYLICDFDVDGFRCDVADQIPLDFWSQARQRLEALKPSMVLAAEGQNRPNTIYAFDANYDWEIVLNRALRLIEKPSDYVQEGGAAFIRKTYESYMAEFPKGTLFWHFTENHDTSNDSYDDRAEKVYGSVNQELALALCFALDGIPLVYNGQEICDASRHSIFSTHGTAFIDWTRQSSPEAKRRQSCLKQWADMRSKYSCLPFGNLVWLENDNPSKICSFKRTDGASEDIYFVGNCSDEYVSVKLENGKKLKLSPWGYHFGPMDSAVHDR